MKKSYAQAVQVSLSLVGICMFIGWLGYFYLRLPHFSGSVVKSMELMSVRNPAAKETITQQTACTKILETLKSARLSSDTPGTTLGELVIHFENGATEKLNILQHQDGKIFSYQHRGALFQLPQEQWSNALREAGVGDQHVFRGE